MRPLLWLVPLVCIASVTAGAAAEEPAPPKGPELTGEQSVQRTMALAASVAFVTAISIVGAAYAVGKVGSAALGAAAEKPELLTRSLAFVALAEGLGVLGFAVAVILLLQM